MDLPGHFNHYVFVLLMMLGLYAVIASRNLVKKLVGLTIFQTSVFILYISVAKVQGGAPPIAQPGVFVYSNPLPHVLILTAIVVSVSTTALGLTLAMRIKHAFGTIEEGALDAMDAEDEVR